MNHFPLSTVNAISLSPLEVKSSISKRKTPGKPGVRCVQCGGGGVCVCVCLHTCMWVVYIFDAHVLYMVNVCT